MSDAYGAAIQRFQSQLKIPSNYTWNEVFSGVDSRVYRATRKIGDILRCDIRKNEPVAPAYVLAGTFRDTRGVRAVPVMAPNALQNSNERGIHHLLHKEVGWLKQQLGFVVLRVEGNECVVPSFATSSECGYGLYANDVASNATDWVGRPKYQQALRDMSSLLPGVEVCLVTGKESSWLYLCDGEGRMIDTSLLVPRQESASSFIVWGSDQ